MSLSTVNTFFNTPHNQAFDKLGAIAPGQHWSAFDVSKADARAGLAKQLVTTIWNFHSQMDEKGRRVPTEKAIHRNLSDGTLWYQVSRPPEGTKRKTWIAHWDSLRLADELRIPIIGVLKDVDSGNCSLTHIFDCGPIKGGFDDESVWIRLSLRNGIDEAILEEFINPFVDSTFNDESDQDDETSIPDIDIWATEGRQYLVSHLRRERSQPLIDEKKRRVLLKTGTLECEVCKFDFFQVYGQLGQNFCEVHHLQPLGSARGEVKTKLEDLAVVCSNCHRMLHRSPDITGIEKLRELLKPKRTA